MCRVAERDNRLVVIVGDISHGIFANFRKDFSSRYFNIGICEPAMVNIAAGLSAQRLIPVVHTIAPFLIERAYEQIKLDFAYQELGVNLISVGGAFDYSKLGCSHHCYSDYSLMAKFKDANIFFPGSPEEFEILFEASYDNGHINYFRLTEFPHNVKHAAEIVVGKALKVMEGEDLTIITTGSSLDVVMNSIPLLQEKGISAEVLYHHTLKPFDDRTTLTSIQKTKRFITVEELSAQDGLYSLVNSTIAGKFRYSSRQIAIQDFIRPYGSYQALREEVGLTPENVLLKSVDLMRENQ
jgi:transketolase